MKKELSKLQLKERQIKKEKIKQAFKKSFNIVCYIFSALFLVMCIALCIGSCNRSKKSNNDNIDSSQVLEVDSKIVANSYNRFDLVNNPQITKEVYENLLTNQRNKEMNYNVSNARFWKDIEFGVDFDSLMDFYAYSYNRYVKQIALENLYTIESTDYLVPFVNFKGGFVVHNISSGVSSSYQYLSFGTAGYMDDINNNVFNNGVLTHGRLKCSLTGGVNSSTFVLFDVYYDFINKKVLTNYESNFSNSNYYFTYELNNYGVNYVEVIYHTSNYDKYLNFGYGADESQFSISSSDGAINSFVDNRYSFVLYTTDEDSDTIYCYSWGLDLYDFTFKFFPIQYYEYNFPVNPFNPTGFIGGSSYFYDSINGNNLNKYMPFYSNGSFFNNIELGVSFCGNPSYIAFAYYNDDKGAWFVDANTTRYNNKYFIDTLVFQFWLDFDEGDDYYSNTILKMNNFSKLQLNSIDENVNISNTRLIDSYDYVDSSYNHFYLLSIHDFRSPNVMNHEGQTVYDVLSNFNYYDNAITNYSLTNVFDLFSMGFNRLHTFFSWTILPNITLGTLIFMPLIVGIIVLVFKAVKK